MSSREQFEEWYRAQEIDEPTFLQRDAAGIYLFVTVHKLWLVWRASRQALVVELPEEYVLPPATDYETLTSACRQQDREAIENAGITVRP